VQNITRGRTVPGKHTTRSMLHRNLHTVKDVRQQVSACMEQRAEAVCRVCDGVLREPHARSRRCVIVMAQPLCSGG
jgi:hypothetical protein